MSFDPEKVERFDLDDDVYGNHPDPGGRYVRASDFDQLLALYHGCREAGAETETTLTRRT